MIDAPWGLLDDIFSDRAPKRGRGRARKTVDLIEACLEILGTEQPTTVRAVAYRLFTRGLIKNMGKNETSKVSRVLTGARESGDIPWDWIVDETREPERVQAWSSPDEIVEACVRGYRRDYWQNQPSRVEVWSEKGTVRGVLAPVLDKYGVTLRVMHGYSSATVAKTVADESAASDKPMIALYVGDYDCSGMGMSETDLPRRIDRYGGTIDVRRIALTAVDVADPALPGFPAYDKKSDPRYQWFIANYGDRCWELDAMRSDLLRDRVESEIVALLDADAWAHAVDIERAEVASMQEFHSVWRARVQGAHP
jgi:hypothetical protein